MKPKVKTSVFIITILLGAALVVLGGYDDSPGAQAIGLAAAVFGIIGIVKRKIKGDRPGK